MMEPITIAAIGAALGEGLALVGRKMVEKGVAEPTVESVKALVRRPIEEVKADETLLEAIDHAFQQAGAPEDANAVERYILNLGLDPLLAPGNKELRQEFARAALLMTAPEPDLIPDTLTDKLRWPSSRRQLLADLLHNLRRQLQDNRRWSPLVTFADNEEIRGYLRAMSFELARTADAAERSAAFLRQLLESRGIAADKPDAQALQDYIEHLQHVHSHLSFLFIKPAGSRRVHTEAELETVFVPLHVHDPQAEERIRRLERQLRTGDAEQEQAKLVTINEVLARYPVFLLKGDPGSGKTTLLRHLTICLARGQAVEQLGWTGEPLLPILAPLRNFGRFLRQHEADYTGPTPAALRHFIERYFREHELELPQRFFRDRLREGRCLVMLDGLDEVADRNLRATVAQIVDAFIREYAPRGNRFGLASRRKGYEEVAHFLPRPVVCTVQPLLPQGRDKLVENLLRVLEPNARRRREETRELLADIRAKDKVDNLSRTPLFCTTLVLVYKYKGATLPERRVDVYHELVDLLLGFWDTHRAQREYTAEARELALLDGTERLFRNERDAVEAKKRALVDLADWMQQRQLTEVSQLRAAARLAHFFRGREGASRKEDGVWACNFLAVAHQRSGLLVEAQPGLYAFSHENFREYLAATALTGRLDQDMVEMVLAHAADSSWDEVILLAAAHPGLQDRRREFLLQKMLDAGHLVMAGRCAVDAGGRLPAPMRSRIQQALYARMTDAEWPPQERHAAGQVLDELGWLPHDLNDWVRCPGCADGGGDLLAARYPVTNAQFERFLQAEAYDDPAYWGDKTSEAWRWVQDPPSWRGRGPVGQPEYWHHSRYGRERPGQPVVGVSWHEANAYAAWLSRVLGRARAGDPDLEEADRALVAGLLAAAGDAVRLPSDAEWTRLAGGLADPKRYPWDAPQGPATEEEAAILARANVEESGLGGPAPVAMHPLGASRPHGLMDMAGNAWEWTATVEGNWRVIRGGVWWSSQQHARCGSRYWYDPSYSDVDYGFRLVFPVVSGF